MLFWIDSYWTSPHASVVPIHKPKSLGGSSTLAATLRVCVCRRCPVDSASSPPTEKIAFNYKLLSWFGEIRSCILNMNHEGSWVGVLSDLAEKWVNFRVNCCSSQLQILCAYCCWTSLIPHKIGSSSGTPITKKTVSPIPQDHRPGKRKAGTCHISTILLNIWNSRYH